jgi:hypothetical protein
MSCFQTDQNLCGVVGTDLALFLIFPPGITELEANIDFEEKVDF